MIDTFNFSKPKTSASSNFVTPSQHRSLRACMVCSIVQLQSKFFNFGCPNCESVLHLAGSGDAIAECTSAVFEGLINLVNPTGSWVAKWQRLDGYVPGMYATKVVGILPEETIGSIEDQGVKYIPRDGSKPDEN